MIIFANIAFGQKSNRQRCNQKQKRIETHIKRWKAGGRWKKGKAQKSFTKNFVVIMFVVAENNDEHSSRRQLAQQQHNCRNPMV